MEERWEAVETCERLFEDTRIRTSTENVGLAKLTEGLELVRIGAPLRPEFAAWRYGDQFGRRRRRAMIYGGAGVVIIGGIAIGGMLTGVLSAGLFAQSGNFVNLWQRGRTRMKLRLDDGTVLKLKNPDLLETRILTPDESGADFGIQVLKSKTGHVLVGDRGRRVAGQIMTKLNSAGAGKAAVQEAVGRIEAAGHPEALITDAATQLILGKKGRTRRARRSRKREPQRGLLGALGRPAALALEMALHEEEERRALQGELWLLEQAWREAEEIAEISDNLLLPDGASNFIEEHRETAGP